MYSLATKDEFVTISVQIEKFGPVSTNKENLQLYNRMIPLHMVPWTFCRIKCDILETKNQKKIENLWFSIFFQKHCTENN